MSSASVDVVVIGGGPGGSICATRLAQRGLSVMVLEKVVFPRFHLGESLLPQSLVVFQEIGVLSKLEPAFLWKYGARFHDDQNEKKDRFSFDGAWRPDFDHAFEVPRDTFDEVLLDHAAESGAVVREKWTVTRILRDGRGRASGVEALSAEGTKETIQARFVVDASGRDTLTAHETAGTTSKIDNLDQTALYAHFEAIPRPTGKLEGDIDIVLFPSVEPLSGGQARRPNWFWFIPFKDGRTSVGAVVSKGWMREHRARLESSAASSTSGGAKAPSRLFEMAVAESKTATEMLSAARCLWPEKEATADFSYRVRSMTGPGWIAIGDAGGFIDPLFSTGAHLAIVGGKLGADAIVEALGRPTEEGALLDAWQTRVREAAETFVLAVSTFYAGPLVGLLFAEDKHAVLRRSITSLLAGDVFTDSVWLRDTRARLREMLASATARS